MSSERSPAEQAAALVADPGLYESFAADYSDEVSFYSALRGSAQESLSFEEYVELRRVFLDHGPTGAIRRRLEERLERSLKNMVLGTSPRGRAYKAPTLAQLECRRRAFDSLAITVPSLLSAVEATVEHLYDEVERPTGARATLHRLLSDTPADERAAVEYVARAWLSEGALAADDTETRLEQMLSTYIETVPEPEPPVECDSAAAYRVAAEKRAFADPAKKRLQEAALHASPSVETLCEYLYLTAADSIEGYRHGDQDISRADLVLARRHLRLLDAVTAYPEGSDRAAYAESYRHLADGIEAGGGRWLTDRAGMPAPEWETVADSYGRAAAAVKPVSVVRFLKYLSKAFRHAAHATDDWACRYQLHINAQRLFGRFEPTALVADRDTSTETLESTIAGTLHVHRCREYEAQAHLAFTETMYDEVSWAAEQARNEAQAAPQNSLQLRGLDTVETIAAARRAERRGEFETALARYDEVETDDDTRQVGVVCHRQLCRVKQLVEQGRHEVALANAHEWFEPGSAVVLATEASCGILPELDGNTPAVSDQFLTIDTDVLSALVPLVRLAAVGGPVSAVVRRQIADCLVGL